MILEREQTISFKQYQERLREICDIETCHRDSKTSWTPENPLWGHCGVVAELTRRLFGGQVVLGRVRFPSGETYRHLWNVLPNGEEVDFAWEQFPEGTEFIGRSKVKDRLTDPNTIKRVEILQKRLGVG